MYHGLLSVILYWDMKELFARLANLPGPGLGVDDSCLGSRPGFVSSTLVLMTLVLETWLQTWFVYWGLFMSSLQTWLCIEDSSCLVCSPGLCIEDSSCLGFRPGLYIDDSSCLGSRPGLCIEDSSCPGSSPICTTLTYCQDELVSCTCATVQSYMCMICPIKG